LQNFFKKVAYWLFFLLHGKVRNVIKFKQRKEIEVKNSKLGKKINYKVYIVESGRLYTDRIHDTAVLLGDSLVDGASFQLRNNINAHSKKNIVFTKGTPRPKKKLNGTVLSLLTGGAGNNNYWHWLFDVLPRLGIYNKIFNFNEIDFFLFPDLKKKFQNQSIDCLNLPFHKRISSEKYRHIETDRLIVTEHPYVVKNDATGSIQNLPTWILLWLRKNFLNKNKTKKTPKKIYIDRKDAVSGHKHMRSVLNESEVKDFLLKKNFSIISLSDYHFKEQVKMFYNAKIIVGLHGAGFANLVFCKPKTKVIELKSLSAGKVIENLSKKMNLKYSSVASKSQNKSFKYQQGNIIVSLDRLGKKL